MRDFSYSKDYEHNILLELHNCLVELEKTEIQRSRENIPNNEIEAKCRDMLEQFVGLAGIIQDGQVKAANSKIADLLGYASSELIGSHYDRFIHPSELPVMLERYEKRLSGDDTPIIYETILRHKNGHDIYVQITASLITYLGKPANFAILKVLGETI